MVCRRGLEEVRGQLLRLHTPDDDVNVVHRLEEGNPANEGPTPDAILEKEVRS